MGLWEQIWDFFLTGLLRGGMYSMMAVGLTLVFGVMNIANFAHGEFYMLGAFFGFFSYKYLNAGPLASILLAGLAVFVVAGLTERTLFRILRRRSKKQWLMNTFLLTLGISIILQNGAKLLWGSQYRGLTQMWTNFAWLQKYGLPPDRFISFLIAMFSIGAFMIFLNKTDTGRAIRAVSQDETGASLVGIDIGFIHTLVFALSGLMAGVAGASLLSITPAYPYMGMMPLYKSWFVLILVGMGNIGGSIVGGLLLGFLETLAVSYLSVYLGGGSSEFICLTAIIAILLFKPNGLFGKAVKSASE